MHDKVTVRTRFCVPLNSYCEKVTLQTVRVTSTFEERTWVLDATYHYAVVELSMHDKVTVRT
jgi:hypothetical protein